MGISITSNMADSSSDEPGDDNEWIFYKDREEWKDVKPVQQDDGDTPVVAIAYTAKFKDVYDYFRAILKSSEKSERALELTQDAANVNPANYTVWQYRREILKALGKDLSEELCYIQNVIEDSPKNYQVWHHRRVIIEWLQDASQELNLTERVLEQDAKNYHAWQHRQWAIKTFNMFDEELNYVDILLTNDIRNNSAWNERYFVINNTTGFTEKVIEDEVKYTIEKIKIASKNESAWNYLRGILIHDKGGLSNNTAVSQFCEELYNNECRSPFLLAFIVDMCEEQIRSGNSNSPYNLERAVSLCHQLSSEIDTIRAKYWNYIESNIRRKANIIPVNEGNA